MVKKSAIKKRSPMYVSIDSRLVNIAITMFILILTIKSEILTDSIIIMQLVMAIPLLIGAMISNARIVDEESFNQYYLFSRVSNSIGNGFIYNTIGLLITKYVFQLAGIIFFALLSVVMLLLMATKFNQRKFYNEVTILVVVIALGILPAIGVFKI